MSTNLKKEKNALKKAVAALLAGVLLLMLLPLSVSAASDAIAVFIDGQYLSADVPPQIIADRTMVPLRAIFEALGATVDWNDETKTVVSQRGDVTVSMTIGADHLVKNGAEIAVDVPAQIVDDRTLVPVRAIAESFDCEVFWNAEERYVRIVSVKLPEPVLTDADAVTALTIDGQAVSEPLYRFFDKNRESGVFDEFAGILSEASEASEKSEASEENADDTAFCIKMLYAICRYGEEKGLPLSDDVMVDLLNASLYDAMHFDPDGYAEVLAYYGTTDAAYRSALSLTLRALTVMVSAAQVYPDFSAEEMIAYARGHYVRAKHILVSDEAQAQKLLDQMADGASFESLIEANSLDGMDPEVGYVFGKNVMVPEFEEAAFALAEGEVSGIVQSEYGFHLIKRCPMAELDDATLLAACGQNLQYDLLNARFAADILKIMDGMTTSAA